MLLRPASCATRGWAIHNVNRNAAESRICWPLDIRSMAACGLPHLARTSSLAPRGGKRLQRDQSRTSRCLMLVCSAAGYRTDGRARASARMTGTQFRPNHWSPASREHARRDDIHIGYRRSSLKPGFFLNVLAGTFRSPPQIGEMGNWEGMGQEASN